MLNTRVPLTPEEEERFAKHLEEILGRLGMRDHEGTKDTPRRMLKAWREMTSGYETDPRLITLFPRECTNCTPDVWEQTVQGPIFFVGLCEHHVLPIYGHAWLGYICGERIIGISKLTRLVRQYARRFTLQERIADEVIAAFTDLVKPRGAAIVIRASHACMQFRGVREPKADTVTTRYSGIYLERQDLRSEFETRRLQLARRRSVPVPSLPR